MQHEVSVTSIKALEARFTAYNKELERVEVFKYLRRLLAFNDNESQAMRANLMKDHKVWRRVSRVLWVEYASPREEVDARVKNRWSTVVELQIP